MPSKKIFMLVLLGLLSLVALVSPYLIWRQRPHLPLQVLIVDKSVPDTTYREHAALTWVLNHFKVPAPDGQPAWDSSRHYLGFHPAELPEAPQAGRSERLQANDLAGRDLVCIADTYGVYQQDFLMAEAKPPLTPDFSPKIDGGLDAAEVQALQAYVTQGGALWAEFNTFASPTQGAERAQLEALLGLRWTGWSGRYFEDLGQTSEVPAWARRGWQTQYQTPWGFQGPGWLLVHEDSRLVVLQQGTDIASKGLRIVHSGEHPLLKGAHSQVPFYYWFDIVTARDSAQVLAHYELQLLPPGQALLKQAAIPTRFPALILASERPLRLYYAGDASDLKETPQNYRLAGLGPWMRLGRRQEFKIDQEAFFWAFYQPLWGNLLQQLAQDNPKPRS